MLPKQHEMDGIIRQLYTAIESQKHLDSTLLVLCGDHGMNDAGNHGGSSAGETSPALVFMSPKLQALQHRSVSPLPYTDDFQYYSTVEQSDIAPTLAALLGFPMPQNNLGVFITDFLPFWSKGRHIYFILQVSGTDLVRHGQGPYPPAKRSPDHGHHYGNLRRSLIEPRPQQQYLQGTFFGL